MMMTTMNQVNIVYVLVAVCAVLVTSILGTIFTNRGVKSVWYQKVKHPTLTPPGYVFSIVWTFLYATIVFALYEVLTKHKGDTVLLALYAINLVLNVAWCYTFFTAQKPSLALMVMVAIWISTYVIIVRQRTFILVPYLAWLTFAFYLNYYASLL